MQYLGSTFQGLGKDSRQEAKVRAESPTYGWRMQGVGEIDGGGQ